MPTTDITRPSVQQGWITLKGKVDWQYHETAAESAVRKLASVTDVSNAIEVKPHAAPKDVKHRIMAALHRNAQVEANNIQISGKDGKVTLYGTVKALVRARRHRASGVVGPGHHAGRRQPQSQLIVLYGDL